MTVIHPTTDLTVFLGPLVRVTREVNRQTFIHTGRFTALGHNPRHGDAGGIFQEHTPRGIKGTGLAVPYGASIDLIEEVA